MGRPIDELTIEGFKSIRSLNNFKLRPLNILIGANGAGKSNFIDFFKLLREMVKGRLQFTINKQGGADAHLFSGPKITTQIVGKLIFGHNEYEFYLNPTVDNRLIFKDELVRSLYGGKRMPQKAFSISRGHSESFLEKQLEDSSNQKIAKCIYDSVSNWTTYHFHDTSETAPVKRLHTVRDTGYLHHDAGNLAAFLWDVKNNDKNRYELFIDTIRLAAPFFDDFRLKPKKMAGGDTMIDLEWTQKNTDFIFHPGQLSDGVLRFMCLTTALLQPDPPATMLFDEPELGLHPEALNILSGLFKQVSKKTQIIVATQSAILLDYFLPEDIVVIDRQNGKSVFLRLASGELNEWLKEYSLGELWQKNVFSGGPVYE